MSARACKSQGLLKQRRDPHQCVGFRQVPQSRRQLRPRCCRLWGGSQTEVLQNPTTHRAGPAARVDQAPRVSGAKVDLQREAGATSVMSHQNSTAWWGYRKRETRPCPLRGSPSRGGRWGTSSSGCILRLLLWVQFSESLNQ